MYSCFKKQLESFLKVKHTTIGPTDSIPKYLHKSNNSVCPSPAPHLALFKTLMKQEGKPHPFPVWLELNLLVVLSLSIGVN